MEQSQTQSSTAKPFQFPTQDQGALDAIKSQVSEFSSAFSRGDAKAVAAFFAPDATLINPVGARAQGREAITQVAQNDMNTFLKGGRSDFKFESARILSNDLALVDMNQSVTGIKMSDGRDVPSMNLHVVALAKKIDNRWLWLDARPYAFVQVPASSVH